MISLYFGKQDSLVNKICTLFRSATLHIILANRTTWLTKIAPCSCQQGHQLLVPTIKAAHNRGQQEQSILRPTRPLLPLMERTAFFLSTNPLNQQTDSTPTINMPSCVEPGRAFGIFHIIYPAFVWLLQWSIKHNNVILCIYLVHVNQT